jgi:hypothetical protein
MHDKTTENLPGEGDALIAYSFFSQGSVMPKFRTEHNLEVLRNTVFSAEHFIVEQMQAVKKVVEGRRTIRLLEGHHQAPQERNNTPGL